MIKKIITTFLVVLALGAGVAYAATQLQSSEGTNVCVNQTNGLMRATSTCRDGEYAMTIGGGSDVRVTQSGTFTVEGGVTSAPMTLPLTGVTISGKCEVQTPPPPYPLAGLARVILAAPSGGMDAFVTTPNGGGGTIGGTSVTTLPVVAYGGSSSMFGAGWAVVTANAATAQITIGAQVDMSTTPKTCSYLWQAIEAPN